MTSGSSINKIIRQLQERRDMAKFARFSIAAFARGPRFYRDRAVINDRAVAAKGFQAMFTHNSLIHSL